MSDATIEGLAEELADIRERAEFYEAERDRERLAAEHHRTAYEELEAEAAELRRTIRNLSDAREEAIRDAALEKFGGIIRDATEVALLPRLAEVEATARASERNRIRAAVVALKFTLFRPGNGPAQTQALEVVSLEDLLGVLDGGGPG